VSFRRRLTLCCAAAVAVAVALGSVFAYLIVRNTLRGEIDASLRAQAQRADMLTSAPSASPAPPDDAAALLVDGPQLFTRYVSRPAAAGGGKATRGELQSLGDVKGVALGRRNSFFADRDVQGVHVRVYTTQVAGGAVQVARPLTEVDRALGQMRWGLGALALAGIAVAIVLSRLATRTAVRPVAQLTATAEHVARTRDLSRRIAAEGEDELSRLAGAFNTMLGELERSQRAQRALVADASHELRTPLTSLRTNLEVLARNGRLPPADGERLRRDLLVQLEELTGLVGDLVELARDDEPDAPAAEDLRMDELVEAAVERARSHAPAVRFETELEPSVVHGVAARLDRAVANLLDNAAKWSPPGAAVEVRLRGGELTVRDHGPGIAAADRPRVFDRFFRSDDARGRPGSGLGLAIVRAVAESHGGAVSAEQAEGGGTLLRLRLPLSPNP
jgi:two-component system sensor histidine kinase MprB